MLYLERSLKGNLLVRSAIPFSCSPPSAHTITVRQIENFPTASGDVPTSPIIITDCGVLSPEDPSLKEDPEAQAGDPYEDYPIDEDRDSENPEIALQIAKAVREVGNKLFKEGRTEEALQKYQSEFPKHFASHLR